MASSAFLLPTDLSLVTLTQIAFYALDVLDLDQDRIVFPEGGGDVDRDLAVPFLPGMDEVVVDRARLSVHGVDDEVSITGWHTATGPSGNGTFIVLEAAARLHRFVMRELTPAPTELFVVRAATVESGAPSAGAPLTASVQFPSGDMLPPALERMDVTGVGTGSLTVTLPERVSQTVGLAWLIQVGTGTEINALTPVAGAPQITSVTVRPAPEDLSLTLRAADGAPEQALWQHPGAMLAVTGDQFADFTPAASGRLSAALAALNASQDSPPTLGLPLRFHSARGGTLGVRSRDLDVRYLVHPLGQDELPLTLDGGWQEMTFSAPPRTPATSSLALTAKHRGLLVNPGSGVPPRVMPTAGVRVRPGRLVAGQVAWSMPDGGSGLLARIRLLGAPRGDTELVCELRRDAGGLPGEPVADPAVAVLSKDAGAGFVSVVLAAPIPLPTGTLWVTARTNRGEFDWFHDPLGATGAQLAGTRVSTDGGMSWGEVEGALAPRGPLVIQLLEQVDPATQPVPSVVLQLGATPLASMPLTAGAAAGEYAQPSPAVLPTTLLAALGAAGSQARRETPVSLWSSALLDLTITDVTCSYDPAN